MTVYQLKKGQKITILEKKHFEFHHDSFEQKSQLLLCLESRVKNIQGGYRL